MKRSRFGLKGAICGLFFLAGCSSKGAEPSHPSQDPGPLGLGEACEKTEDCQSLVCLPVKDSNARCSKPCLSDLDCPSAKNWNCATLGTFQTKVCACEPNAAKELCDDHVDNDCDGKVDDCAVCNGKAVEADDPLNCGACGVSCGAGQECSKGACQCTDSTPLICGKNCANPQTDHENCGGCGNTCGADQSCSKAKCVCIGAKTACAAGCVDLESDASNCGACGNSCDVGSVCKAAKCSCPAAKDSYCPGFGCVSLNNSVDHCGACSNQCVSNQSCTQGSCGCVAPQQQCGNACVSVLTDSTNCGTCGNICETGKICSQGKCACPGSGNAVCGSACTNTNTDISNCGHCGKACESNQACISGECKCPLGMSWCDSSHACLDLSKEQDNCGDCGKKCGAGEVCTAGLCQCKNYGETFCDTACVSLSTSNANCGACNKACPTGSTCSSGKCQCVSSQLTVCGASCTDLGLDKYNCGTCGKTCGGNATCKAGTCMCPAPTIGSFLKISDDVSAEHPKLAWNGTHIGIAYVGWMGGLTFTLLNPDGTRALTKDLYISTHAISVTLSTPSVVWNGTEWGVAWQELIQGDIYTRMQRIPADASNAGSVIEISGPHASNMFGRSPALGFLPGQGYAVLWSHSTEWYFTRIGVDNTILGTATIPGMDYNTPRASLYILDNNWLILDDEWGKYRMQKLSADASQLGPKYYIGISGNPTTPALLRDATSWVLGFGSALTWSTSAVKLARGDQFSTTQVLNSMQQDVGHDIAPDVNISLRGTDLAVVWRDPAAFESNLSIQRWALPPSPTELATPLTDPILFVPTKTVEEDFHIIHTTLGKIVVVWADRFSGSPQVFTSAIDTSSCP